MGPAVSYRSESGSMQEQATYYAATYEGMASNGSPWCSYAARLGRRIDRVSVSIPMPALPFLPRIRMTACLRNDGGKLGRRGEHTLITGILVWLGADTESQVYLLPISVHTPLCGVEVSA